MMRFRNGLAARAVMGAVMGAVMLAGAARAEPAIWVVKDADSTIFLFGTVHILRPQTNWRTARIDAAIAQATELWLEIIEPKDPAGLQAIVGPLMARYGLSPDRTLSSRLTAAERATLQKAVTAAKTPGLDMAAIDQLRPWLVATLLSVGPLEAAGYDTAFGVEKILEQTASGQGDRIRSFEAIEQQLLFLATLPDDVQLQFLRDTLADTDVGDMDRTVAAWAAGDIVTLEREVVADLKAEAPQLYEVLLARRNADWAGQIEAQLKGSGVSFMAVGAAHLIGPDSVQAKLKGRGIEAQRY